MAILPQRLACDVFLADKRRQDVCLHFLISLQVASLVGADPKEIIFTSGATEANNLAIKGVANFYKEKKNHIITLQTDHKCVLDSCRYLQNKGFKVTYLPVKKDGLVDLELLEKAITPETVLVSVMMVNNEIGMHYTLVHHLHIRCKDPMLCAVVSFQSEHKGVTF